jgi:hypothetical protein
MNPASATEAPLLFNWAPPKAEKLAIAAFVAGSVVLHALCFYVFQIIYPPAVALLSPPARVNLVVANSEEGRTVLRWIEAEDPALASATVRPPDARLRALPRLRHVPSYITDEPKLKDAPPPNPTTRASSPLPPAPVAIVREQRAPAWPLIPTHVLFSEELAGFGKATLPEPRFTSSTGEPPANIRFRIGINSRGEVRYCFRLDSSGDANLDEQARLQLVRCRFPARSTPVDPEGNGLVWGVATVEWGNDVAHPRSISAEPAP